MSLGGVKIVGVGHHAPANVVTNEDLEQWLDTSDEWIASRTGMKSRHWARPEESTGDLALAAAGAALEYAGIRPADVDCYIVCTVTPDYYFPATACLVAARLGAKEKPAFDVSIACSGFLYGDGAGAVILEASEENSFLSSELGSDASRPELLYVRASGSRHPIDRAALDEKLNLIQMQGPEVFKSAVIKMIDATGKALAKAGLTKYDVTLLIPHQANKRIIDAAAHYLEMPAGKVVSNIHEYGNTSAASIPIALSETVRAGEIRPGNVILFVAFGGGLSWGAVAWRWAA